MIEKGFYIIHDKDINDNGELKTPHLHLFIKTYKQISKQNLIKEITDYLEINSNQISIKTNYNEKGSLNYFTHKNQPEKYQYNHNDIKYINYINKNTLLNENEILNIMRTCENFYEFTLKVGLTNATKYNAVFTKIRNNSNDSFYIQEINFLKQKIKDLETLNNLNEITILNLQKQINDELKKNG